MIIRMVPKREGKMWGLWEKDAKFSFKYVYLKCQQGNQRESLKNSRVYRNRIQTDNTRDSDKETSYSKLIVKAMKINTFYKGKQEKAEN